MQAVITAPSTLWCDKSDVFSAVCPDHIIALLLHIQDESLTVKGVFQRFIYRMNQV